MNKIFKGILIVATFATVGMVSSCTKTCDTGYEGSDCKTEVRTKYVGNYSASEVKNGGAAYTYSGSIATSSAGVTAIVIDRIPNAHSFFNTNVKATVNGAAVTIADQTPDNDAYHIAGTGALSGTTLTLTFTVTGPNNATPPVTITDSYTSTWTKQ
jgi:hypothetical protein